MKIAYRTLHHCFIMQFCLIYHGVYQRAGTDAVDAIIAGAVEQSRFLGLLMVKNVLTYITTNGGGEIKIHSLAQDKRAREEMTHFESWVRNIQKHGIYAPFARVLGLPGVTHWTQTIPSSICPCTWCFLSLSKYDCQGEHWHFDIKLWKKQLIRMNSNYRASTIEEK